MQLLPLNQTTANTKATRPIKIMQFGGGNFLRAFVDWMVQELNDKTDFNGDVVIIKPTERGDYADLKSQDGLFHVVLDGIKNGKFVAETKLVSSVQQIINVYTQWDAYSKLAENPDIRFVISNTTEAGIKFNSDDRFEATPPKEFPAKLTLWLYKRFAHFKGDTTKGCILLPCELIENNGKALKKCMLQYAAHWGLNEDFAHWIHTANYFCSTLVDRIVSGYPTDRATAIHQDLGFEDKLLVAGEQYHSWVIEGAKAIQSELPFTETDLNVEFVDDLAPYREMKVRILNGAHTSMVPVGYLAGIRLVREAMQDGLVSSFVESLLMEETVATLDFPDTVKHKFANDVLDRFRNPSLEHRLISISLNSTSKFVARLLPTLKDYSAARGTLPKRIVFGLSCLLRLYKGEFDGKKIDLKDDQKVLDFFAWEWEKHTSNDIVTTELTTSILSNTSIWGEDLTQLQGLVKSVSHNIDVIEKNGIRECLKSIL